MNYEGRTICPITHYEVGDEGREFKCLACDFKTREGFKAINEHQATHTGEKPFQCYVCKEEFGTRKTCQTHIKFHHTAPELKPKAAHETDSCLVCGAPWDPISFECSKNESHWHDLGDGLFRCGVEECACLNQMAKEKLLDHLRMHTNARPYPCRGQGCAARFRSFYERKGHEKVCEAKMVRTTNLQRLSKKRSRLEDNEDQLGKKLKTVANNDNPINDTTNQEESRKATDQTTTKRSKKKLYPCMICKEEGVCKTKHSRCTTCAPYVGSSFREQAAMKAIKEELGVNDLIYGPFFKQYQIPGKAWRVDGYSPSRKTIYEYHSARHHGETNLCVSRLHTLRRMDDLCAMGYKVVSIWGPNFLKRKQNGSSMKDYLEMHVPPPKGTRRPLPPLESDEEFLVTVLKGWIKKKDFEPKTIGKAKSYLGNLVDYAIDLRRLELLESLNSGATGTVPAKNVKSDLPKDGGIGENEKGKVF